MNILESAYGRFNVYVNHLSTPDQNLIHLSFVDKDNKTQVVLMKQIGGKWFFADPTSIPLWIISLQEQFDVLIKKDNLQNYHQSV
jgi:hypothetical protein